MRNDATDLPYIRSRRQRGCYAGLVMRLSVIGSSSMYLQYLEQELSVSVCYVSSTWGLCLTSVVYGGP